MIAMYHSLHQAQKNADGDCKLAVESLQDSNLSSKSVSTRSQCFHFPNSNISVIPYTHVPTGKTFHLTASIVLFPDPLETRPYQIDFMFHGSGRVFFLEN